MNIWHITTEADSDGRGTRSLGFFTGSIKDILIHCYPKRTYNLYIKLIKPTNIEITNEIFEVDISASIGYGEEESIIIEELKDLNIKFEFKSNYIKILGHESLNESDEYKDILSKYDKLSNDEKDKLKKLFN